MFRSVHQTRDITFSDKVLQEFSYSKGDPLEDVELQYITNIFTTTTQSLGNLWSSLKKYSIDGKDE